MNASAVCRLRPMDGHEWVLPQDDDDFVVLRRLVSPVSARSWKPIAMRLLTEDDHGRPLARAALPWLGSHALVLRGEAVGRLGPVLSDHGTLLPLVGSEELAVFCAPVLEDVLDLERSELVRFSSGRIMRLTRPVFRAASLHDVAAFKLAEMPEGELFLSSALVEELRATGDDSGTVFEAV